ncbi:MAG: DUF3987 domain-containing protein, partial [Bacteroidota bacterium]
MQQLRMTTHSANDILAEYGDISQDQLIDIGVRRKTIKNRIANEQIEKIKFPVECLPPRLTEFIKGYMEVYDVSADHYGLCMLVAGGAALGNSVRIDDRGTDHPPVIYDTLVDRPGSGKTPTLNTILRPFVKREIGLRKEYAFKQLEARQEMANTGQEITVPKPEQVLYNDFTLESLVDGLQASPRGILAYHDEIEGFLSSMDRYRSGKGGDGPFWLSAHTGAPYKNNRRNRERPVFLPRVFCPFVGGIQPGLLTRFGDENRESSGFLARILFSIPDRSHKQPYHNDRPDRSHAEHWEKVINYLFQVQPKEMIDAKDEFADPVVEPHTIQMSDAARNLYAAFYNGLAARVNSCEDETEHSTLVKFETHTLRIALILHFLDWASRMSLLKNQVPSKDLWLQSDFQSAEMILDEEISGLSMQRAIKISEYFMATGLQVVNRLKGPQHNLPHKQRIWYEELSEEPTSKEALEAGKAAGMSTATINRLLAKSELFKRMKKGHYL